jgi:hypothetical protein
MTADSFIARWSAASASERSDSQLSSPNSPTSSMSSVPTTISIREYALEFTATEHHHDGSTSEPRIDLYKRACFVLESKQFQTAAPDPTALAQPAVAAANSSSKRNPLPSAAPTNGTTP